MARGLRWIMIVGGCVLGFVVMFFFGHGPRAPLSPTDDDISETHDSCEGIVLAEDALPDESRSIGGLMDGETAMTFLFAHYDRQKKVASWCPAKDSDAYRNFFEAYKSVDMLSAIAFSEPYSEGGHPHFIVVIQTAPFFNSCHACTVVLGAAVFEQAEGVWRLKHFNPTITHAGSYGRAPEQLALVQIGPNLHGVAVTARYMGQGYTVESYLLLGPVGDRLEEIFSLSDTGADNKGNCDANVGDPKDPMLNKCWAYSSQIRFVPGADTHYFDLEVLKVGTKDQDHNTIVPFEQKKLYGFNGCYYSEGPAYEPSKGKPYCIQVAAFESYPSARDLADRLRAAQFPSYCDYSAPTTGRSLLRVRIGDYRTQAEAKRMLPGLKQAGYEGIVRKR